MTKIKTKKVLIKCDYGKVFIKSPKGTRRNTIIEMARLHFRAKVGQPIEELPNVKYLAPSDWRIEYHDSILMGREDEWKEIDTIEVGCR